MSKALTLKISAASALLFISSFSLVSAQTKSKQSKIQIEAAVSPAPTLLSSGHVDEAIALLQKQLSANPSDAAAYNLLARAYYSEDATDPAIKAGERSVELAPQNAIFHLWLGRIYGQKAEKVNPFRAAGFAGKCREQFEQAVRLDPANLESRADLAEFYTEAPGIMGGGKDKARAQADAISSSAPGVAHLIRARIAEKEKNISQAEQEYKSALSSSRGKAEQWLNLANFYHNQQRTDEMQSAASKAATTPRSSAVVLYDASALLFHASLNFPLAIKLASDYLASNDKSEGAPAFKAHLLLGRLLEKQGDTSGAVKQYETAIALARDFSPAREALKKIRK